MIAKHNVEHISHPFNDMQGSSLAFNPNGSVGFISYPIDRELSPQNINTLSPSTIMHDNINNSNRPDTRAHFYTNPAVC